MTKKGETDTTLRPKYGEIVYKNFTFIPLRTKIQLFIIGFVVTSYFIMSVVLLFSDFIMERDVSLFYSILFKLLAIMLILMIIYHVRLHPLNYHEYILFENGILESGYWNRKNEFTNFKDMKEVLFFPSYNIALDRITPIYIELRKDIIHEKDWNYWSADDESMKEDAKELTKGVMIIRKSQKEFLTNDYLWIEDECFKDLNKFRKYFLPLIKEYKIKLIDNYKTNSGHDS